MKHFLDIHKTDATDLRAMINSAHAMKQARNNRPKGTPDDDQPLSGQTARTSHGDSKATRPAMYCET